ncbi:MAG: hypothetical protein CMP47_13065 [Rickettsiales bacterium]|nr:hypothetical protein [Rickettsiales bacterium]
MAKNLLDTSTVTLDDILSSSKVYHVPPYQRDYSWSEEHWEDLWEDIKSLIEDEESYHYMGSIVLQRKADKESNIIDGQQRFTTFTIIILAIINRIEELANSGNEKEQNEERVKILRRNYLGDKHPTTLRYTSKLFLNRNNDEFFQSHLLQLREPNNINSLAASNKKLHKAFRYFSRKINELENVNENGAALASLITELLSRRMLFIQINVEDELSAYIVFETLNARGVELTATDLLKNYLFSLIGDDREIEMLQRKWKRISDSVGSDKFPDFVRYYINSKRALVRAERLFKNIKDDISTAPQAIELLDQLESNAKIFAALKNHNSEVWSERHQVRPHILALSLFNVKQITPMLLAAYNEMSVAEFTRVVKLSVAISFRYSVICRKNPNELEKAYNSAAIKISNGEITTARQVHNELRNIYVSDEEFEQEFSTKVINNNRRKKLVRYILFKLEGTFPEGTSRSLELDDGTIEHILPENPSRGWNSEFPTDAQEQYIYRLGNYTLLEPTINRNIGNAVFSNKRERYNDSQYAMTNNIEYVDWNIQNLTERQQQLARKACHIWRSDFAE